MYYVSWSEYKGDETIDYLNAFDNEEDRDRFARSLRYKGVRTWEQPMWAQEGEKKKVRQWKRTFCVQWIFCFIRQKRHLMSLQPLRGRRLMHL